MISKKIGLLIVFLTILLGMFVGKDPLAYLDLPSLIFVFGIMGSSFVAVFGFFPLFKLKTQDQWSHFYHVGKKSSLFSGFIGLIMGFFIILVFLSDIVAFGPAVAVALLSYLYSTVCFLFFTLRQWQLECLED